MRLIPIAAAALAACLPASFASAQTTPEDARVEEQIRYMACLNRAESDPEEGFEDAIAWRTQGGGWPAQHCQGLALIHLGDAASGAAVLADLAGSERPGLRPEERVLQWTQAGDAWLSIGEMGEAETAYGAALDIHPGFYPARTERAVAALANENWDIVVEDTSLLIDVSPTTSLYWRQRAEAHLGLDELDRALRDINRALEIAPESLETLVLRGRIVEARRVAGL